MDDNVEVTTIENIEGSIFLIRGHKVILSSNFPGLYGAETCVLVQAAKRNIDRSLGDFMCQLTAEGFANLNSENETYCQMWEKYSFPDNMHFGMLSSLKIEIF